MKIHFILIILTFLLLSIPASASSCMSHDSTTTIVLSPGINNNATNALDKMIKLKRDYKPILIQKYPNERFKFDVAINPTYGPIDDLREMYYQKFIEFDGMSISDAKILSTWIVYDPDNKGLPSIISQYQEYGKFIKSVSSVLLPFWITKTIEARADSVQQEHIQKYQEYLLEGNRVIILAHSQGNFFANTSYSKIQENNYQLSQSLAVIGIATLSGRAVDNRYVTAKDDFFVNELRDDFGNILDANTDNKPIGDDFRKGSNHFLFESYLDKRLKSRDKIDQHLHEVINYLPFPTPQVNKGAITITLNWGANPDVDLHILEPDLGHVYYQNKKGTFGELDKDVTNGYGAEHYYLTCDNLQAGTYKAGVIYYTGKAGETASVMVSTYTGKNVTRRHTFNHDGEGKSRWEDTKVLFDIIVSEDTITGDKTIKIQPK